MKRFIVTFKDASNCEIIQYRINADTIGQAFEEAFERVSRRGDSQLEGAEVVSRQVWNVYYHCAGDYAGTFYSYAKAYRWLELNGYSIVSESCSKDGNRTNWWVR